MSNMDLLGRIRYPQSFRATALKEALGLPPWILGRYVFVCALFPAFRLPLHAALWSSSNTLEDLGPCVLSKGALFPVHLPFVPAAQWRICTGVNLVVLASQRWSIRVESLE